MQAVQQAATQVIYVGQQASLFPHSFIHMLNTFCALVLASAWIDQIVNLCYMMVEDSLCLVHRLTLKFLL